MASKLWPSRELGVFFDQEFLVQHALAHLGIALSDPPSQAYKVGRMFMRPDDIPGLRLPYAVEVLGMSGAGKTTMINRYLQELWRRKTRHKVYYVDEGARTIREREGQLRVEDPFLYSMMGGMATFGGYNQGLVESNTGVHMFIADRGQVDRRVFRRALFSQGHVSPKTMVQEEDFIYGLENTPIQIGGMVMLMVKPETAFSSRGNDGRVGPVRNMDFLPRLYEQYWRLHWEILEGKVPYRVYTCIDAEEDTEMVYERFRYAMDVTMNIHHTFTLAASLAWPDDFDRIWGEAKAEKSGMHPAEEYLSRKLGERVRIVGGDEMGDKGEILNRVVIEGVRARR